MSEKPHSIRLFRWLIFSQSGGRNNNIKAFEGASMEPTIKFFFWQNDKSSSCPIFQTIQTFNNVLNFLTLSSRKNGLAQGDRFFFDFHLPWLFPDLREISLTSSNGILVKNDTRIEPREWQNFYAQRTCLNSLAFPWLSSFFLKFPDLSLTF